MSSANVTIRDWRTSDLDAFARWHTGAQAWQRLDGPYYARPPDDTIGERVDRLRARIEKGDWPTPRERLAIADAKSDDLLGSVSRYWISEETRWLAIGIVIYDPAHWGQGIGYQALGIWCDYLWDALPDIVRLDLRTWSGNLGMIALAKKLGFREEARFRQARIVDGEYHDALGFGILRDEWARPHLSTRD